MGTSTRKAPNPKEAIVVVFGCLFMPENGIVLPSDFSDRRFGI